MLSSISSALKKRLDGKTLLHRYWRILKPFRKTFAYFVAVMTLYEGLQVFESYTISLVVRMFGEQVNYLYWVALFVGIMIYDELFIRLDNGMDWHIITRHSHAIYRFLKLGAIQKFLEMDLTWHQKRNSGALVGKISNGVEKVNEMIDMFSWEFVPTIIQTILSIIPLLFFSPLAAIVAIFAFVIFSVLALANQKERKPLKEKRFDLYEYEWHRSIEIVQSVETNYMFGQTDRLIREQERLHQNIIDLGKEEVYRSIYHYIRWQIRTIKYARIIVLMIWVGQLYSGTLDIPNLIFANVILEKLFNSFWRFSRLLDRAAEAGEGAERLANILEEKPKAILTGDRKNPVKIPVGIELKDVRFAYSKNYKPDDGGLHDLTISIPPGEVVAFVGPSGAGKTTIRKIVTGLMSIHSGTITVGGVDIRKWCPKSLLQQFSYVPQGDDVFLFNETLKSNIAFAKPEATDYEIKRAALLAGIDDFIDSLPDGYETVVGERGKRLSGGQKQRVALARAIIADRPILILDEATSAVDAITEEEIQRRMKEILAGKTAIIIAHRLSTIWDIADKIVVLDKGRKVEEGSHEELVSSGGLYAKMVALQTKEISQV